MATVLHPAPKISSNEGVRAAGIVDPGDLHQLLVVVRVAQQPQRVLDAVAGDGEHDLPVLLPARDDRGAERGGQRIEHAFVGRDLRCGVEDGHAKSPPLRTGFDKLSLSGVGNEQR